MMPLLGIEPERTHHEKKHRQPFSSLLLLFFFLRGFFWRCLCAAADLRIQYFFLKMEKGQYPKLRKRFFFESSGWGGGKISYKREQKSSKLGEHRVSRP
jgi:hypothetical protein